MVRYRFISACCLMLFAAGAMDIASGQTHPATAPATAPAGGEAAKIAKAKTDLAAINLALATFEADCGRFPSTDEGLAALMTRPDGVEADAKSWPMLKDKSMLTDPWGHPYIFRFPSFTGPGIDLICAGPDGKEGTEDDITLPKE